MKTQNTKYEVEWRWRGSGNREWVQHSGSLETLAEARSLCAGARRMSVERSYRVVKVVSVREVCGK